TPLLCMAQRLAATGAGFAMHYCTRSAERTAFRGEIAASSFADRVSFHFDDGPPEQMINLPAVLGAPQPECHVYICGPAGFINFVLQTAQGMGWPAEQLHLEYFAAAPQD